MIYEITDKEKTASLFSQWEETLIWSCLQSIMGSIYADDLDHPTAAMAICGDFAFFSGTPNVELVSYKPDWCTQDFIIMVPQNDDWKNAIVQFYGSKSKIVSRYAIKKEPDVFDTEKLEKIISSLPDEYELCIIDEPLYQMCKETSWSTDLVSQFQNYEEYRRKGLACVCGAKLILECLKQNLYPSWDAQNKASVALAEKLGYHYSHTYTAIEIYGY